MSFDTTSLLDRRPVFRSHDVEETHAFLRGKEFRFEVQPRALRRPDVRVNGVYLPSIYVGYLQYGMAVTISANPARGEYWIQLPIRGRMEATIGGDEIDCDSRRGVIESPTRDRECPLRLDAESARVHLRFTRAGLIAHLAALLGETPEKPLEFAPTLDLTSGYGRNLAGFLRTAVADLNQPHPTLLDPLVTSAFEQFLLTGILTSHPHNFNAALARLDRTIAPRDVKRAVEFIDAHLDTPLTVGDIVTASGVPGRTLFKHFQDYRGISPMRHLRNKRLEKVHETLLRAEPEQSVTDIASRWGFSHMGRFSVEYRRRFGECPSQTLRRHVSRRSGRKAPTG